MTSGKAGQYGRHLRALLAVYFASAVTVAVSTWLLTIAIALGARVVCAHGCGAEAASWAKLGDAPWTMVAGGLFFLPLGTMFALMLLPPFIAVAYPLAVLVVRYVPDRRRVTAIGGLLGGLIGPAVLAIIRYVPTVSQYRMSLIETYEDGVWLAVVQATFSGAVIGWIVTRPHAVPVPDQSPKL